MNKKSILLLTLIAVFAVIIGVSYAHFMSEVNFNGDGSDISGAMREIDNVKLYVEGSLAFDDKDIYPGHKNVASIKVSAYGNGDSAEYKLVWKGTNTLKTELKYYVYKYEGDEVLNPTINCEKRTEVTESGTKRYYETCENTGFDELGSYQWEGTIASSDEYKTVEFKNEQIVTNDNMEVPKVVYYYVVLEYPNEDYDQVEDLGGEFSGEITIDKNDTYLADISFSKVYKHDDNGKYLESTSIPQKNDGYVLNEYKSSCSSGDLIWDEDKWTINVKNLTNSTVCELYFDKQCGSSCKEILANKTINTREDAVSEYANAIIDNTTNVIYKAKENDSYTYYFAGAPTDNYVKFAGFYWRIVRINYDGSIRLIYAGSSNDATGAEVIIQKSVYNTLADSSEYSGYKYLLNKNDGSIYSSTVKSLVENWYQDNLLNSDEVQYIDKNATFCNDRTINSGSGVGAENTTTYMAKIRLQRNDTITPSLVPTYNCENSLDLFSAHNSSKGNKELLYPVGLITGDEVSFAGGVWNVDNKSYFLYAGSGFWTMTPIYFLANGAPYNGVVTAGGRLGAVKVNTTSYGIRPVINLRADLKFSGTGTADDPYMVKGGA